MGKRRGGCGEAGGLEKKRWVGGLERRWVGGLSCSLSFSFVRRGRWGGVCVLCVCLCLCVYNECFLCCDSSFSSSSSVRVFPTTCLFLYVSFVASFHWLMVLDDDDLLPFIPWYALFPPFPYFSFREAERNGGKREGKTRGKGVYLDIQEEGKKRGGCIQVN